MDMAKARIPRDVWIAAALRAIARDGVGGVAVERLAAELGISRGSFYWHFADREELLRAAMETWEREGTEDLVESVASIRDPADRLMTLCAAAVGDQPELESFEAALFADASHPLVASVLARVTARRLDVLNAVFAELGLTPAAARERAVSAYALYVGWIHLRRSQREQIPEVTGREGLAQAVRLLLPDDRATKGKTRDIETPSPARHGP